MPILPREGELMKTAFSVEAVEQFRIPNGTNIEFRHGWIGIVTDQSGPDVQITYGDGDGNFEGIVVVPRDKIVNRKVVQ